MSKLYKYPNYQEYINNQIQANRQKLECIFVEEESIQLLSEYLKNNILLELKEEKHPRQELDYFGICHGTRRGKEQEWFQKYLGIKVIGTEISPTATQFKDTIQHDFHEVKDEWIQKVDFIYSNSFDHSPEPEYCLDQWMKCIRPNGVIILEWTVQHGPEYSDKIDPYGASIDEYIKLINKKYKVIEILKRESKKRGEIKFIIIKGVEREI